MARDCGAIRRELGPRLSGEDLRARRARYLPERYTLLLVSGLDAATVARTYATHAPSLEAALARARELVGKPSPDVAVLPDAGDLVPRRVRE